MFILVFFAILSAYNYYLYAGIARGLGHHSVGVAGVILVCFLSLFVANYMERRKWHRASLPIAWVGYHWVGVVFVFGSIAPVFDLFQVFVPEFSDASQLQWMLASGGLICAYGFVSARRIAVKTVSLTSTKVTTPFTLVQISDLHLGDSSSLKRTRRLVERVNAMKPDLIVSTGDLFDGYLEMMGPYVKALQELGAPLGKFAVVGNHEVYAGLGHAMELTRDAGLDLLQNESRALDNGVTVAGIDDPAAVEGQDFDALEARTFENVSNDSYTLFLNHRPSVRPGIFDRFDLQLSGHTHGGQIFPFHFLTKLVYSAKAGLTELKKDVFLYVSRGTGTWGPQFRVLAPLEVTRIRVKPVESA